LIYGFSVVGFRFFYICTHNGSFRFMVLDTSKVLCNGRTLCAYGPGICTGLLYEAANCFTASAIVSANSIVAPPALLMAVSRVSNIILCYMYRGARRSWIVKIINHGYVFVPRNLKFNYFTCLFWYLCRGATRYTCTYLYKLNKADINAIQWVTIVGHCNG